MDTFTPTGTQTNWQETGIPDLLGLSSDKSAIDEARMPALIPEGRHAHYSAYLDWNRKRMGVLAVGGLGVLYLWSRLFSNLKASSASQGFGFFGAPAAVFMAHEACEAKGRGELKLLALDLQIAYRREVGLMGDAAKAMGDAFKPAIQRVHQSLSELLKDEVRARGLIFDLTVDEPHTPPQIGSYQTVDTALALLQQQTSG